MLAALLVVAAGRRFGFDGCGYSPDCSSAGVNGVIDEARISRIARSIEWISIQVLGMRELATFLPSESAEQLG